MQVRTLSVLAPLVLSAAAAAQPTSFTYQGRLKDGAALAAGLHDFRFTLFNVASGGVQLVPPACVDNILVTEGLFTATLDFGQQFVTTSPLFLQIEVRADTGLNCANTAGLILLGPRQPLTAAPIASHAKTAFSLAAADGSPPSAVIVDNDGNVGIGTSAPTHTVHIASPAPTLALQDTDSTTQQVGYVSYRDAGNVERAWVGYGTAGSTVFSIVNARSMGHIALLPFSGGNVGIGTTTPAATLDVRGDIRLGPSGQFRATAGEENLRIIRGRVSAAGGLLAGSGFTVERTALGRYTVTFSQSFAAVPTVTATTVWELNISDTIVIEQVTSGAVSFAVNNQVVGGFADTPFHFMAIGPR